MDSAYVAIVNKRKDRAIAIILGVKEKDADPYLPSPASAKVRKVVLDQVNDLTDFVVDIIKSLDGGTSIPNEDYFLRLEQKIDELTGHDRERV